MEPIYTTTTTLRTCECDMKGQWRPSAIFESLQEVSQLHVNELGIGFFQLRKAYVAWILTKMHLSMSRYPKIGDTVKMTTWPGERKRCFHTRYYILDSEDGSVRYGAAASVWVLLDLRDRSMFMQPPEGFVFPTNLTAEPPVGQPPVKPLDAPQQLLKWRPVYHDIDVNGHVNNTRYIDRICDQRPIGYHKDHDLTDLVINYNNEILPDTEVELDYRETPDEMSLSGSSENKKLFIVRAAFSQTGR